MFSNKPRRKEIQTLADTLLRKEGKTLRGSRFRLRDFIWIALLSAISASAQQLPDTAVAPVPPAIFAAKKVFVSNAGADSALFPHPFSGSPDRGYNQFYAALQRWGRYDLVTEPEEADLVFELQLTGSNGPTNANRQRGATDALPMFRLSILDRKTHYVLWVLTKSIAAASLQKTHDRNFDEALASLTIDLKKVATKSPPTDTS